MSLKHRYDFVLLFDVKDGNPNGDPDAGNLPRLDAETGHGLVTDVALKRKVRNFVALTMDQTPSEPQPGEKRFEIYVREKAILNQQHQRAYSALRLDAPADAAAEESDDRKDRKAKPARKGSGTEVDQARRWMCQNFYDVRMFGAVMTTGVNCGQVRGPIQLTFARSIDPIVPLDLSITRVAVTRPEDLVVATDDGEGQRGKQTEMGRKALVPYGLYRAHGFFNPHFGAQTAVVEADLALFWQALQGLWDQDRSASRGQLALRGLYVFSHASPLGNAPAHRLFERIVVARREGIEAPRRFTDYAVQVHDADLPDGVTLHRLEG